VLLAGSLTHSLTMSSWNFQRRVVDSFIWLKIEGLRACTVHGRIANLFGFIAVTIMPSNNFQDLNCVIAQFPTVSSSMQNLTEISWRFLSTEKLRFRIFFPNSVWIDFIPCKIFFSRYHRWSIRTQPSKKPHK
jgi:hypothetical protein